MKESCFIFTQIVVLFAVVGLSLSIKWTGEVIAKALSNTPLENYIDFLEPSLQKELTKRQ